MIERIIPIEPILTVNDVDYDVKIYAKINIEGKEKIVVGISNYGLIVMYEGLTDVSEHMGDTEEQLRTKLIEVLEIS